MGDEVSSGWAAIGFQREMISNGPAPFALASANLTCSLRRGHLLSFFFSRKGKLSKTGTLRGRKSSSRLLCEFNNCSMDCFRMKGPRSEAVSRSCSRGSEVRVSFQGMVEIQQDLKGKRKGAVLMDESDPHHHPDSWWAILKWGEFRIL